MHIPKPSFRPGCWVRLKDDRRFRAVQIEARHDSFAPGAVYLREPLDGTKWWNVDALVRAQAPAAR